MLRYMLEGNRRGRRADSARTGLLYSNDLLSQESEVEELLDRLQEILGKDKEE